MDFFYVLVFQKFPGFLGVVAPEIVNLVDDVGFGEQFLEEDVAVKPVGLSKWVG